MDSYCNIHIVTYVWVYWRKIFFCLVIQISKKYLCSHMLYNRVFCLVILFYETYVSSFLLIITSTHNLYWFYVYCMWKDILASIGSVLLNLIFTIMLCFMDQDREGYHPFIVKLRIFLMKKNGIFVWLIYLNLSCSCLGLVCP